MANYGNLSRIQEIVRRRLRGDPVSLIAIVIGAAFGLLLTLCSQTNSKVLQELAKIYIDVVRGTPMDGLSGSIPMPEKSK